MIITSRSILLAAGLLAAPVATAMAQQNNPAGNMGSNQSVTASPGTADSHAASGMNTGDLNSSGTPSGNYSGATMNRTRSGTGVPGTNSSVASSAGATRQQQTGPVTPGGK